MKLSPETRTRLAMLLDGVVEVYTGSANSAATAIVVTWVLGLSLLRLSGAPLSPRIAVSGLVGIGIAFSISHIIKYARRHRLPK